MVEEGTRASGDGILFISLLALELLRTRMLAQLSLSSESMYVSSSVDLLLPLPTLLLLMLMLLLLQSVGLIGLFDRA